MALKKIIREHFEYFHRAEILSAVLKEYGYQSSIFPLANLENEKLQVDIASVPGCRIFITEKTDEENLERKLRTEIKLCYPEGSSIKNIGGLRKLITNVAQKYKN